MGTLNRTELLTGILTQVLPDLVFLLGWHGTLVCLLFTVLTRSLRQDPMPQNHVCVATVLLGLMLMAGPR